MENSKDILNNLPPFHIGQKVVKKRGLYFVGNTFTIDALAKAPCGCWLVKINRNAPHSMCYDNESSLWICAVCEKAHVPSNEEKNPYWFYARSFSPLQQQSFPLISLTKVIEETKELVAAN